MSTAPTTNRPGLRGSGLRAAACAAALGLGALLAPGCVLDAPFQTAEVRSAAFDAYHRGERLAERGRYAEALEAYLEAIELSPRPAFLHRAGSMHRQLGNPERALFYFDQALEAEPGFAQAQAERDLARLEISGRLLEARRPDAAFALEAAQAAAEEIAVEPFTAPSIEVDPEAAPSPAVPRDVARPWELMSAADFRPILFPELMEGGGRDAAAIRAEAERASAAGRWLAAVNLWARLATIERGDPSVRLEHARALERSGRTRRALEELEAASREFDQNGEVWFRWGNLLASIGSYAQAEARYLRAASLMPGDPLVRNNLGALYLNDGRLEEAAAQFRAAIAADPAMAAPYLNLALALDGMGGQSRMALQALERYIELGGERRREAEDWMVDLRAKADAGR